MSTFQKLLFGLIYLWIRIESFDFDRILCDDFKQAKIQVHTNHTNRAGVRCLTTILYRTPYIADLEMGIFYSLSKCTQNSPVLFGTRTFFLYKSRYAYKYKYQQVGVNCRTHLLRIASCSRRAKSKLFVSNFEKTTKHSKIIGWDGDVLVRTSSDGFAVI